ncbi:MAG: LysR family transcriptional regulator [Pseudomonadota bacterium]
MYGALSGINLNRLLVFVAVVEVGSITGAASKLGIAKTMASAHMQRLEAEVGASLLLRTTRRLALTEAGEAFYEAARAIVQSATEAVNALGQDVAQLRGTLRITAPIDYGAAVIAPLAVKIMREHPLLKIEIVSGDRLFDLVGEGIDVAIRLGKLADSNYQAVRVSKLDNILVAAPTFMARSKRPTKPEDLAALPFIALSVLAQPLSWTFNGPGGTRQSVNFEAGLSVNTAHAMRSAVLAGGGLAVLPDFAVSEDLQAGRLVQMLPKWSLPSGGVFALFPATRYRPRKVNVLIDALKVHLSAPAV